MSGLTRSASNRAGSRPLPRRPGFTLLEATVALAIVGLVAVAALAAYGAELRAATRAGALIPAAALAEERMSRLLLAPADMLDRLPDSLAGGRFAAPYDGYEWRAESGPVPDEPALRELTVTVSWREGRYELRRRRYEERSLNDGNSLSGGNSLNDGRSMNDENSPNDGYSLNSGNSLNDDNSLNDGRSVNDGDSVNGGDSVKGEKSVNDRGAWGFPPHAADVVSTVIDPLIVEALPVVQAVPVVQAPPAAQAVPVVQASPVVQAASAFHAVSVVQSLPVVQASPVVHSLSPSCQR